MVRVGARIRVRVRVRRVRVRVRVRVGVRVNRVGVRVRALLLVARSTDLHDVAYHEGHAEEADSNGDGVVDQDLFLGLELLLGLFGEQAGSDGLREGGESKAKKPAHLLRPLSSKLLKSN